MKRTRSICIRHAGAQQGSIIMISLWILALLSLLSVGLAHRVAVNAKLIKFQKDKLQCFYAAKAAVYKAAGVIAAEMAGTGVTTLNQRWSRGYNVTEAETDADSILRDVVVGGAAFTVRYPFDDSDEAAPVYFYGASDEDRKMNVNTAPRNLLRALFDVVAFDEPDALADALIYWRGDDQEAHDAAYGSAEMPYEAPKAPLQAIEELSLVKGFRGNEEMITACAKYLSVFARDININTAPLPVLEAVFVSLGASRDFAERLATTVIDVRSGADRQQGSSDDVAITAPEIKAVLKTGLADAVEIAWVDNLVFPFTDHSRWFRIEATATAATSVVQKKVSAVVSASENYRIVYWHEE